MIKVNLLGKKKPFRLPVVLGMDLNQINVRMLIVAIIFSYIPDFFIQPYFQDEIKAAGEKAPQLRKEIQAVDRELRKNNNLKKMLDAFNNKVEELKQRSIQVEKIVKQRTNPKDLLERLARNTPDDLWLEKILISQENNIEINGGSTSYRSIGDFIVRSNETPYFGQTLNLTDSSTKQEKLVNNETLRVEAFTIKGKVVTFDPFAN